MMATPHLGERGVHPVVAQAARELLNKSANERSGVLSTAMSFLGLYRDPIVARVTSRCDWRISDLVEADHPVSLYLVVPPSDISRTKPLVRLILNQIGRRLTESLEGVERRHQLLLMLDEFAALGRLDFFETALAFQAGYAIRAFLICQSLNQLAKAYGENNSVLDNCHVRIAFACNDERTAKRISDALGIATERRAMKNYAGHRLSPWLSHLMVSRQETARPLLTPGEVMQLPATDEIIMVAGLPPIRAKKIRYYEAAPFVTAPSRHRCCQFRTSTRTGQRADPTIGPDSASLPTLRGMPFMVWTSLPMTAKTASDESPRCRSTKRSHPSGGRRTSSISSMIPRLTKRR
jgi:type IV secretion system protein VirD4